MPAPRDTITTAYLKTIWMLQHEECVRVGVTQVAERIGRAMATVSQTVQALAEARLIRHEPYGPIELTLKGEQLAIAAIRNERMTRAFLYRVLGYPRSRVAAEAERLAPVLHRDLAERLHRAAGAPAADPFGNPIPGIARTPGVESLH
ncbi:MAG: metal-dependent transcriptional regulator [Leucobacter sp.]